jgi:tetrapyrrole methylase family protein/MazG family protein
MKNADSSSANFAELLRTIQKLRRECPWDQKQTVSSLGKHLIEESYEALDAIDRNDMPALEDELGDLLAQILFIAVIGEEAGDLSLPRLLERANEKLIRRHPHVFGDVKADSAEEVVQNWEEIKRKERESKGSTSALDGIAASLPSLMRAEKLGQRARTAGMDWPDIDSVLDKVEEELAEVRAALKAGNREHALTEVGDMLLALGNAPRFLSHTAEQTLRDACEKFTKRFREMEKITAAADIPLIDMSAAQVDRLWHQAKANLERPLK